MKYNIIFVGFLFCVIHIKLTFRADFTLIRVPLHFENENKPAVVTFQRSCTFHYCRVNPIPFEGPVFCSGHILTNNTKCDPL